MSHLPVRVYSPEPLLGHPAKLVSTIARDIWAGRELAWRLFIRDLSAQYRQTFLGYIWAFLPPLVASMTFIFLNSQGIVQITGTGIPYPAFAMMGTLLWQVFVDAIMSPPNSFNAAKSMLAKSISPRSHPARRSLHGGLQLFHPARPRCSGDDFLASPHRWQPAVFPFAMASLLLTGFAIGLALTPLAGLYGDIGRGIPIIAQFWMLLTPVVYPARTEGLAGWLATWNPISPLITTARECLTAQPLTLLPAFWIVTVCAAMATFLGLVLYRLAMPHLIVRMGG